MRARLGDAIDGQRPLQATCASLAPSPKHDFRHSISQTVRALYVEKAREPKRVKRGGLAAAPQQGETSSSVVMVPVAQQGMPDLELHAVVLTSLQRAPTGTVECAQMVSLLANLPMATDSDEECQTLVVKFCRSAEQTISSTTARAQRLAVARRLVLEAML